MDLEVLEHLIDNESYITEQADSVGAKSEVSLVIAKILLDNKGDISSLKGNQIFHYERVIKPLFENVECVGPIGLVENGDGGFDSSCVNGARVDEESLLVSYQDEDFLCQICRFDNEKNGF